MNLILMILVFLLPSCSISQMKARKQIAAHSSKVYPFKGAEISGLAVPNSLFTTHLDSSAEQAWGHLDLLKEIKPGNEEFFFVWKAFLGEGGEGDPSNKLDLVILRRGGGPDSIRSGVFVQYYNEIPSSCWNVEAAKLGKTGIRFVGRNIRNDSIEVDWVFQRFESGSLDSIKSDYGRLGAIVTRHFQEAYGRK